MTRVVSQRVARAITLGVTTLALHGPALAADADASVARGRALFEGIAPLRGRIDGHVDVLPPSSVACINCHGARTDSGASSAAAPPLGDASLAQMRPRRNGPPAAYDASSFCHALRTGVDPAQVRLPLRMPRFALSDDDCRALWTYLDGATPP